MGDMRIPAADKVERLAAQLATVVPPPVAASIAGTATPGLPRPSPLVQAALAKSAARSAKVARRAQRRSRSVIGAVVDSFVAACSFIPYALVALAARLVIARVFFLSGQTLIEGPRMPLTIRDFDFSVILPLSVKSQTFSLFLSKLSATPIPPMLATYVVTYAEFLLPICLVLGFATRLSALALLLITAMVQLYLLPDALWTTHAYWATMLLMLLSLGPGQISVDHIIRFIARR
ncbi:MAG TPA: DoxX family protein [Pseudolabrys sp.]|nr:DoxX family protein [Pseudolabrys sp.]